MLSICHTEFCIDMFACVFVFVFAWVHVFVCVCLYLLHLCLCLHECVSLYECVCLYEHICISECVFVCVRIFYLLHSAKSWWKEILTEWLHSEVWQGKCWHSLLDNLYLLYNWENFDGLLAKHQIRQHFPHKNFVLYMYSTTVYTIHCIKLI